jgi:hypothetical protein
MRILLFSFSFLIALHVSAQNLVPNPSFEEYEDCPNNSSQIDLVMNWVVANEGTPDYFNSCFVSGVSDVGVPENLFGFQSPQHGAGYCGLFTYFWSSAPFDGREYLQVQLTEPLIPNSEYVVSFFVSKADSAYYVTDNFAVCFTENQILSDGWNNLQNTPQIVFDSFEVFSDSSTWQYLSASFLAEGGEAFMTLGNFLNDAETEITQVQNGNSNTYKGAYYYVDNVCVAPVDMGCNVSGVPESNFNELLSFTYDGENLHAYALDGSSLGLKVFDTKGSLIWMNDRSVDIKISTNSWSEGIYILYFFKNNRTLQNKIVVLK